MDEFKALIGKVTTGAARDLKDGMEIATKSIDSGEAKGRLDRLIALSNA